eukprot:s1782_g5.t1
MVFAKKEKCPVCGAVRPTISGSSGTERMRGSLYRRYEPAPGSSAGPVSRRDFRSARDYMVRSVIGFPPEISPSSVPAVDGSLPRAVLQVEGDFVTDTGVCEVVADAPQDGRSSKELTSPTTEALCDLAGSEKLSGEGFEYPKQGIWECDDVVPLQVGFGFTPFWSALGERLELPECTSVTGQGTTVVFDQGCWPDQCAWCLRPFSKCLGCVFPSSVAGVQPSSLLPRELQLVGSVFDEWKVQLEVGIAKRQWLFGTTNPTQLLGKSHILAAWELHAIALSETSHTVRASRAISAEFRSCGLHVGLCRPVPDKFEVGNSLGSFRGLSRGCGLVSPFPLYSFESPVVDARVWCSQRIHFAVVQVGQLAVNVVTVYLWPNAPLSSRRYVENCEIIGAAVQVIRSVSGPTILAGDFNAPHTLFQEVRDLMTAGWVDTAQLDAERRGVEPQPTCLRATRHTFCLANPLLLSFLVSSDVRFHEDLATHAVLVTEFNLPDHNFRVLKWVMPKPLDKFSFHKEALESMAGSVSESVWAQQVDGPAQAGQMDLAFSNWSIIAEEMLCAAVEEPEVHSKHTWKGRGQALEPVLRDWAPPRFRAGRGTDFRLSCPSVALEARRWQKLARQLEALVRKLTHGCGRQSSIAFTTEVALLWAAIYGSPIRPRFPRWVRESFGFELFVMPGLPTLKLISAKVAAHAQEVGRRSWRAKRDSFAAEVDDSWKKKGGSLAFRLLKDRPHPPVMEMEVSFPVKLQPQRWLPDGKQWLQVFPGHEFVVGDRLVGKVDCSIADVREGAICLDRKVTRTEAASLAKVEVSLDPAVWSRSFFEGWNEFWQREQNFDDTEPWKDLLQRIPREEECPLSPVTFDDWRSALAKSKTTTMRGTCGWSVGELELLPGKIVEPLLRIFELIEKGGSWPKQLQTWLLVLLRKEEGIPTWKSVRPISVASVVYRVWARVRTFQLLQRCQNLAMPTVGPRMSTRSLWGFVADFVAEEDAAGGSPSGVVLDIIKAFNVMRRPLVMDVMLHFGLPACVVAAWMNALNGMERQILVAGCVYPASVGLQRSTAGVPEGDPLSVVAMFCMCLFFARFVTLEAEVLPVTYADNWQVISRQVGPILVILPKIHEFLERCALPVSPEKCWLWSADKVGRKRLKQVAFGDSHIPVRLQAVDLGADMPYCRRRAAAKRNGRITAGHRRLQRARGMPGSKWQKSRLILSGIWPQCLHGSETCVVPKSVLKRLRTQAGRVASIAKPGVSPWLACSVGSPQVVDPEFCLLLQRLRLFRLMWRDFPASHARMQRGLSSLRSSTRGVSYLLAKQLRTFEWIVQGLVASDDHGRCFHLVNSPLKAVRRALETSWLQKVGRNVVHRKDCGEIDSIDAELTRVWQRFPLGERSLLLAQITGVTFTRDCLAHIEGAQVTVACPLCGEPDSRLHRAKFCVAGGELRAPLLRSLGGQALPDHTWAYGLWDEIAGLREWQAHLCSLRLPLVVTSSCEDRQFVFTDGSCLFPTKPKLRLSGGAVILASPGAYQVVWSGIVPGLDQSSYRAEVLAICVAVGSFRRVTIFCDNSAVVRIAERLLKLPVDVRRRQLPQDHRDLWEFFCEVSEHQMWGQCVIRWVKAHQDPTGLSGHRRILALFNSYADREAKAGVKTFARHALYRALFERVERSASLAVQLADFHVRLAGLFCDEPRVEKVMPEPALFEVVGQGSSIADTEVSLWLHEGFTRRLSEWLSSLRWFPSTGGGLTEISALELLWQFVFDTGSLPPFWYEGRWHSADDHTLDGFVVPSVKALYRVWVRHLVACEGLPGCGEPGGLGRVFWRFCVVKDFRLRALDGMKQAEKAPKVAAEGDEKNEAGFRAFSLRAGEKNHFLQGLASETQWSKCAEADSDQEGHDESDEDTPLRSPSAGASIEPNRYGAPADPRVPANSPDASVLSESSLSVKDRWAKGKGTKEDWEGLLHKAHIFVLRSYLALSERDPQIRYVEETTRAFIEAWERGSLEDPIMTQTMLTKVRSLFNSHLHKAFACLDFHSVDDLLAAAESSGGSGAQFGLLGPGMQSMMAAHSRYLLQMAMAVGDRKALALALAGTSDSTYQFTAKRNAFFADTGFALRPWVRYDLQNSAVILQEKTAFAMGNYLFEDANGGATEAQYTFGYVKDEEGALRIHVFMASIPADGEDLKFAQEGCGGPRGGGSKPGEANLTEMTMEAAQLAWAKKLVEVGNRYVMKGDYHEVAEELVDECYAFSLRPTLFKPAEARLSPFRTSRAGAVSYFAGGDKNFPEDWGFALRPWKSARLSTEAAVIHGTQGLVMGHAYFDDALGIQRKAEFAMGFVKSSQGVRINLHHTHFPNYTAIRRMQQASPRALEQYQVLEAQKAWRRLMEIATPFERAEEMQS